MKQNFIFDLNTKYYNSHFCLNVFCSSLFLKPKLKKKLSLSMFIMFDDSLDVLHL